MAVLVDSSLWVHQLRRSGDRAKRERVNALLEAGLAAWCPPVRLELWRGVVTESERAALRRVRGGAPRLRHFSPRVGDGYRSRRSRPCGRRDRSAGRPARVRRATVHGLELARRCAFRATQKRSADSCGGPGTKRRLSVHLSPLSPQVLGPAKPRPAVPLGHSRHRQSTSASAARRGPASSDTSRQTSAQPAARERPAARRALLFFAEHHGSL